jgi:hypothetical protein
MARRCLRDESHEETESEHKPKNYPSRPQQSDYQACMRRTDGSGHSSPPAHPPSRPSLVPYTELSGLPASSSSLTTTLFVERSRSRRRLRASRASFRNYFVLSAHQRLQHLVPPCQALSDLWIAPITRSCLTRRSLPVVLGMNGSLKCGKAGEDLPVAQARGTTTRPENRSRCDFPEKMSITHEGNSIR